MILKKELILLDSYKSLIKKYLIFGDYDVDGYSSTYLLYDYFKKINKLNCDYYIPDRFNRWLWTK